MSKRILLPLAALSALAVHPALAADMPALRGPVVVEAPLAKPAYDWSGFYIGGQAGASTIFNSGRVDSEPRNVFVGVGQPPELRVLERYRYNYGGAAFTYGLYAGALAQYGSFVFGLEADFNGPMRRITGPIQFENSAIDIDPITGAQLPGNDGYRQRIQSLWDASIRARFGYASGATLIYGTAGLAIASFKACSIYGGDPNCNFVGQFHQIRYTTTRVGWTIGAGIEHKLTHNWAIRAEYRYTMYGATSCLTTQPCAVTNPEPGITSPRASDIRNRVDTHAWRVGLTYTFAAPPAPIQPVIARN